MDQMNTFGMDLELMGVTGRKSLLVYYKNCHHCLTKCSSNNNKWLWQQPFHLVRPCELLHQQATCLYCIHFPCMYNKLISLTNITTESFLCISVCLSCYLSFVNRDFKAYFVNPPPFAIFNKVIKWNHESDFWILSWVQFIPHQMFTAVTKASLKPQE